MVTTRQSVVGNERGEFALVPDESRPGPLPETAACPQCNWQPQVSEIVEIVVHTREEARWATNELDVIIPRWEQFTGKKAELASPGTS
jgi:hypothetical protein